jgi:hypothetical protein
MTSLFFALIAITMCLSSFNVESGLVKNHSQSPTKVDAKNDSISLLYSSVTKPVSLPYDNDKVDKVLAKCYDCITKRSSEHKC